METMGLFHQDCRESIKNFPFHLLLNKLAQNCPSFHMHQSSLRFLIPRLFPTKVKISHNIKRFPTMPAKNTKQNIFICFWWFEENKQTIKTNYKTRRNFLPIPENKFKSYQVVIFWMITFSMQVAGVFCCFNRV